MTKILVVEDRQKQSLVFELNFYVYLGADVTKVCSREEISNLGEYDLIVCRSSINDCDIYSQVKSCGKPIIVLGEKQGDQKGVTFLEDSSSVRIILRAAANILNITPKKMMDLNVGEYFPIAADLLNFLIYFPCDIFEENDEAKYVKVFNEDDLIEKEKLESTAQDKLILYVNSSERLRFTNSFTEQFLNLSQILGSDVVDVEKKMDVMNSTMDHLAGEFQKAHISNEVIELAKSSIGSLMNLAESFNLVTNMQQKLLSGNFNKRFVYAQTITCIGFHLIEHMDWLLEDAREHLTAAAFFHDLCLFSDEDIWIRNKEVLSVSNYTEEQKDTIANHAHLASKLLSTFPEFPADVKKVIREHHGSLNGQGFSNNLNEVSSLAKIFIIAEEWAYNVIKFSESIEAFQIEELVNGLKERYPGEDYHKIIDNLASMNFKPIEVALGVFPEEENRPSRAEQINHFFSKEQATVEELEIWGVVKFYDEKVEEIFHQAKEDFEEGDEAIVKGLLDIVGQALEFIEGDGDSSEIRSKLMEAKSYIDQNLDTINSIAERAHKNDRITRTNLMLAAQQGNLALAKHYVDNDLEDVNKMDYEGRNSLHYAAIGGSKKLTRMLVNRGAKVNAVDNHRRSPLFYALKFDNDDVYNCLVEEGARVTQQTSDGVNLAMLAALKGDLSKVEYLLDNGVPRGARDSKNKSIIDYARKGKQAEVLEFLKS